MCGKEMREGRCVYVGEGDEGGEVCVCVGEGDEGGEVCVCWGRR